MKHFSTSEQLQWIRKCVNRRTGSVLDWCAHPGRPSSGSLYKWSVTHFNKSLPYVSVAEVDALAGDSPGEAASSVEIEARALVAASSNGNSLEQRLSDAEESIQRRDGIILDLLAELEETRASA